MPVDLVTKMWSRTSGTASAEDKYRRLRMTFTEGYQVTHTPETPKVEILGALDLPEVLQPFENTDFVLANVASFETIGPIMSLVLINYEGEVGVLGTDTSPLLAPPTIDYSDVVSQEEATEDFDGNPLVNANNEPIEGVKREIPDLVLTVKRNFATFNTYTQGLYRQSVNSDLFDGWPPGTARLTELSARNVLDKQLGYWEVSAKIQFRYPYRTTPDKAWYWRDLHKGFYEKVAYAGPAGTDPFRIVRAVDKDKMPTTKPVLLDEDGYRIDDPTLAVYKEFKLYGSLPYNALGLI